MANGNLTIQQVYDDLQRQLQSGYTATLSQANLPSADLWTLVYDTLATNAITVMPSGGGAVVLGPISGDSLTLSGSVSLLQFLSTTTITVTVTDNVPNMAFTIQPPAGNWTFGQSFWQLNVRDFNNLSTQISGAAFDWASAGKTRANALVFRSSVSMTGFYGVIQTVFAGSNTSILWSGPIAFDDNGPNLNLIASLGTSAADISQVVYLDAPFFQARLTYLPAPDDPPTLLPAANVALGMQLDTTSQVVNDFKFYALFSDGNPTLYITGKYDDPTEVMTLSDVVQALMQNTEPPTLPAVLQPFFNAVGLQAFSCGFSTSGLLNLIFCDVVVSTNGTPNVWDIYSSGGETKVALQEMHLTYAIFMSSVTYYQTQIGGTLRIFDLIFSADLTFDSAGTIALEANLTTVDGLPLRFSDMARGLGCDLVAAGLENFFDLGFSELGARLVYTSGDQFAYSVYANADISLKFFGKELLALHNTFIQFDATPVNQTMQYRVFASGLLYFLGANLPVTVILSDDIKRFTAGPVSFTLGDIITALVNLIHPTWNYELPAPWNVLNAIGFQNLTLSFDLNTKTIILDTGLNVDFGWISITRLALEYRQRSPEGQREGVILSLQGTFLGLTITTDDPEDEDSLSWDLVNGKPPAVPGAGEQLFKLDYLGLGQHVTFRNTRQLKTIGDVITALETNFLPTNDTSDPLTQMNDLVFNENSGWLIGTKFTVLETVTLSAIFNDPVMYGLRIALAGETAGALAGLEFEILYKRITDTIGLYHIDLMLPDAIRQLEFGEVSVQIPEFILDIYTNGNFKLDVGFPHNGNFDRSVGVEVFPFVGFGGFYFGYLNGDTSDRVPAIDNGEFNPVLEFGIGLAVGVGKTIEKGMLRAGATLTVEGILEGVLAWFHPDDSNQPKAMYYDVQGTIGIDGHVYGAIDFAIVKASVDIRATAIVTLEIAAYQPIHIELKVDVSAKVKVKVLFVTIKLSFELELDLEWTVGHASPTPWHISDGGSAPRPRLAAGKRNLAGQRHPAKHPMIAPAARRRALRSMAAVAAPLLNFTNPARAETAEAFTDIALTFAPLFSQSDQEALANIGVTASYAQRVCSIPLLVTTNTDMVTDPIFQQLVNLMFTRAVDARLQQKPPAQQNSVSLFDLTVIHDQLAAGLHDSQFSYDALTAYFTANDIRFVITPGLGTLAANTVLHGTLFPMIPALTLSDRQTDPGGGNPVDYASVNYATDSRFMIDQTYEDLVNTYFRTFQAQSETALETGSQPQYPSPEPEDGTTETTAQFIFRDYFLMITRAIVDAAIQYLESYPYTTGTASESLQAIAMAMSTIYDVYDENPTALTIALANQSTTGILQTGASTLTGVLYQVNHGDSLLSIASTFGIAVDALVDYVDPATEVSNGAEPNTVVPGVRISLGDITYTTTQTGEIVQSIAIFFGVSVSTIENDPGNSGLNFDKPLPPRTEVQVPGASYTIVFGDTLVLIADRYQTTAAVLAQNNQDNTSMLAPLSVWSIPPFTHEITAEDTLLAISQQYALSMDQLLQAGYATAPIIAPTTTVTVPYRPEIEASALFTAMDAGSVTDPIAVSVSRFMMYGLRLPQISPITFDTMYGLFNLTGQQLEVPAAILQQPYAYQYQQTLTCSPAQSWVAFDNGGTIGGNAGTYTFSTADLNLMNAYEAQFAPAAITLRPLPLMTYVPNRYALRQVLHWQSPDGLAPVTGTGSDLPGEPNIWLFPDILRNRLNSAALQPGTRETSSLAFELAVARQEQPNQPPVYSAVDNFAWGTLIGLQIKTVKVNATSGDTVADDYLMLGADPDNRDLLYDLWMYMANEGASDTPNLFILFSSDPAAQSSTGVSSDLLNSAATALLKSNLSTTTNQPMVLVAQVQRDDPPAPPIYAAPLSDAANFIKLLWECSAVNTGGYYLNYRTNDDRGLPENIFDQSGTGIIQLLVIFDSQKHVSGGQTQPAMLTMTNCGILTDHLDLANAQLVVKAATYTVQQGQSLATVQAAMGFADMQAFVDVNQTIKLLFVIGYSFTANGILLTVQAGDSLVSLAARANTTPIAIANALATATDALIPGAILAYALGQIKLQGTGPVGSVGFEVTRANPDPLDLPFSQLTTAQQLNLMFNLLGYDLVSNSYFQPRAMTLPDGTSAGSAAEGFPLGPVEPKDVDEATKTGTWVYQKITPFYPFAVAANNAFPSIANLPASSANPYAGIAVGAEIGFSIAFQDVYGNRSDPAGTPGGIAIPVGYSDNMRAFATWPGMAMSYWIKPAASQPPQENPYKVLAEIDIRFRVANYLAGSGQSNRQAQQHQRADQEKLTQIYYQYLQPDVQPIWTVTLDAAKIDEVILASDYFVSKSPAADALNGELLFLAQLLQTARQTVIVAAGDNLDGLAANWLLNDAGAILEDNQELFVNLIFDLTGGGTNDDKLHLPIIIVDAAADTLTTLVNRAKTMPGVDPNLTVDQFATTNANVPLNAGIGSKVPQRAVPPSGDPAIGDGTLLDIAVKYQCTVAKLAEDNASTPDILRAGTVAGFQGLLYSIQSGDTFSSLAQNMMVIAVPANATIQAVADSRGMSVGAFASANTSTPNLWQSGQNFTYMQQTVTVTAEDTLYTIANKFAEKNLPLTVETLAEANKDTPGLFGAGSHAITGRFNVTISDIALANEALSGLFAASAILNSTQYVAGYGDTIQSVVTFVDGYSPGYTVSAFATANALLADLFATGTPLEAGAIYTAPENAETMAVYAARNQVSMAQVAEFNGAKLLKAGSILGIPDRTIVDRLNFSAPSVAVGGSLTAMAGLFGQGTTEASLINTNLNMWRSLIPGTTITYTGVTPSVSTVATGGDTFDTVWQRLQPGQPVDDAGLAAAIDEAQALRPGAVLQGPAAQTVAASQPSTLAATWGVNASDLLTANRSLTGFIAASVPVAIVNGDGATLSFTTRANETLNTLFDQFLAMGLTLTFTQFSSQLPAVDGLIAANARFVLPPALDNIAADINTYLPAKIFRLVGNMDLARVNFLVTNQTIADLKTIPDVAPTDADKLTGMANQATTYIDGDSFDAALRDAFGPVDQINYLIMLTRRFSVLPSILIDPSFADVPAVYRATTTIPAHTNTGRGDTGLQSLQPFAAELQAAYLNALKVGASAGPFNSESSQSARKLWCVDFTASGYGYAFEGSQPSFFAPTPIATALQNKANVPMRKYISGEPALVEAGTMDVKSANLDTWAAQFLQTLDLALSPAYAVAIYELDATTYEALVGIKDGLADKIGAGIANALATPINSGNLDAAQAAFTDRLKINLADAYRFEAIIQFPVTVTRGGDPAASAARLVGQPTNRTYVTQDPALPNQVPEMIDTMAQRLNVSQTYLVGEISAMQGILDAGGDGIAPATVIYDPGDGGPTQSHVLDSSDSLASLAQDFGLPSALGLIGHVSILEPDRGLFAPGLPINVTAVGYSPVTTTTFEAVAIFFDISVPALGTAVQDVAGIFNPAATTMTYQGVTKPIPANATLGEMADQFGTSAANLANYQRLEPDLVAAAVDLNTIEILPNYDLSTTKAALASGGSNMTFCLDLANQAQEQKVFMNLDFVVNQMEFDISNYPGDTNYQRSSWLNFILPFDSVGGAFGNSNLGQTEIPIVLEAYPDTPVFGNQDGIPSNISTPNPTLTQMKNWDYTYEFTYREAAQDRIYTGITINDVHAAARGLSRAELASRPKVRDLANTPSDLLEALAQFDANLTDLMGDLSQLPYYQPGDTNPAVVSAIAALLEFAAQILANWDKKPPHLNLGDDPAQDGIHDFQINMTRDREEIIYFDTMIIKAIDLGETLLPGKVEILLDGTWADMPEDPTASSASERVFLYPTAPSRVIADATYAYRIGLQNLDVIQYQSAGAGVQVKRNQQLISAGPTNSALIYTTPAVHSANMFTPLIVRDRAYQMDGNEAMVDALSDFFKDLFDIDTISWPPGTTRLIKVHAAYGFNLLENRLIPQAPAILRTQYPFNLESDYQPTPGTFVSNLAAVVTDWMDINLDASPSGSIIFDVIVFEAKTDQNPSPVLDLRTITYPLT